MKCDVQTRLNLVLDRLERGKSEAEVCRVFGVSRRTVERLVKAYEQFGVDGLRCKSRKPLSSPNQLKDRVVRRIIEFKQAHPAWGARRIAAQLREDYRKTVHWNSVHRVLKRNGLLVRVKAKHQPSRRFQRKHVDSLWQMDCFEFRIRAVGRVFVFDVIDDCSRYLVATKAFLDKRASKARMTLRAAFKRGRKPRALYVDNGTHFSAVKFKRYCKANRVKLIFGTPYHPQGRGKIEAYHKTLHRELIKQKQFASLTQFRRELRTFATYYNKRRLHGGVGWRKPAQIYFDERYFNKQKQV